MCKLQSEKKESFEAAHTTHIASPPNTSIKTIIYYFTSLQHCTYML